MFGNLINDAVSGARRRSGRAPPSCVIMFVVLLAPMLYYVRMTERAEGETV